MNLKLFVVEVLFEVSSPEVVCGTPAQSIVSFQASRFYPPPSAPELNYSSFYQASVLYSAKFLFQDPNNTALLEWNSEKQAAGFIL